MIYLDNAATSFPKPPAVAEAMERCLREGLGNPGRSGHRLARESQSILKRCRLLCHRLFGGGGPERFIFTSSCTDSLNLALRGLLHPGDHVITGELEHNSLRRPLDLLRESGVQTSIVSAEAECRYSAQSIEREIRPETRLVAISHASNVLGVVHPIAAIGSLCRRKGILFLVDAAQTAGVLPIDVDALNVDLLAAPGHKSLWGPMGTGLLYIGELASFKPWRVGGTGGDSTERLPTELPWAFEAGTPNVIGLAGLAAGLETILEIGIAAIQSREVVLREELDDLFAGIAGVELYPTQSGVPRLALQCFRLPGFSPEEAAAVLDQSFDIAVRAGLHCAPGAHRFINAYPTGAIRVSPGYWNAEDDLKQFALALHEMSDPP
jgi:cysteine desulfurase family protein